LRKRLKGKTEIGNTTVCNASRLNTRPHADRLSEVDCLITLEQPNEDHALAESRKKEV
jgi:hypothetical protein